MLANDDYENELWNGVLSFDNFQSGSDHLLKGLGWGLRKHFLSVDTIVVELKIIINVLIIDRGHY